jgi:hypothetical protein
MKKRLLFIVKKHKRSKNKQKTNIYRNQMKKKISYRQSIVKIESIGSEMTNKTNVKHTERKICLLYLFWGKRLKILKG